MQYFSALVFVAFLLTTKFRCGYSLGVNFWKIREKVEHFRESTYQRELQAEPPIPEQYITQPLDHFDPAVQITYKQRYWVNTQYWSKPDGPVFLFIGGEGGLTSSTVKKGEHVELAQKYGALILAVEHRYYGNSINDDGLELNNMQYLASQQALADLASFHSFITEKFKLTNKNTWICFGGSYPGALSAWFRLKYPHLVYGAIASSAPVKAKVNFEGYCNVVAASLADPVVNGSQQCATNVKKAFKIVDDMLIKQMIEHLAMDFKSCKPIQGDRDIGQFASNLAGLFMGVVQYNNEAPGWNISKICEYMTSTADVYYNLIKLNAAMLDQTFQDCSDNSWTNFIIQLKNTKVDRNLTSGVGIRQWLYQTCTQFGYYQSCDTTNTSCPFSRWMDLKTNLDICDIVFQVPADEVYRRVQFTNAYYGADQPRGTRIVFVNGSIDPWHALSVLKALSSTETAIYINGTAHCANMGTDKKNDPQPLRVARQQISNQIGQWLQEAKRTHRQKPNTLYFKPAE